MDDEVELFENLAAMEYRICGDQAKAREFARRFLDEHAHALAERIRGAVDEGRCCVSEVDGMWEAANYIDPEVSS